MSIFRKPKESRTNLALGEGAPHPTPIGRPTPRSRPTPRGRTINSQSTTATVEMPKTPQNNLSLINPNHNSIPQEYPFLDNIDDIEEARNNDKPHYDENEATKKSKLEEYKKILREMAQTKYPERILGQAILIRTTLEEERDELVSKPDYNKNELKRFEEKIEYQKNREKLLHKEYKKHINDLRKTEKFIENQNSKIMVDWINKLLIRNYHWNMQLTPNTSKLYSYLVEFYKPYLLNWIKRNELENKSLSDKIMFNVSYDILSRKEQDKFNNVYLKDKNLDLNGIYDIMRKAVYNRLLEIDKERFEKELTEANLANTRKGGKTKKRRSKRNRKSRRQRK